MAARSPLAAEIVTTGTEILLGDIVDTNAAWIAQQLREIGVNLYYKTTVGDNEPRLRGVLETALARSDVILVTGGLGPTADDITRDAIANATGRPLVQDDEIVARLRERFARWGARQMTENNLRQAFIPEGATVIPNPVGTAPGFLVEDTRFGRGARIIAMPGVPREMKRMMTDWVLPYLRELTGGVGVIRRRILRTVGIGESALDAQLGELMDSTNPTVGLAAHLGQADIRVAARAETPEEAEALIDDMEARIRERVGAFIYSTTPEETIETVVVRLLQEERATLGLLETVTGGRIAKRVRAVEGGDHVLAAAWTETDAPASLQERLAGGLFAEVAQAAAQVVREASGATYGLAVLGSGRPGEDFYALDAPGETWIGLAGPDGARTARFPFGGRDRISATWIGNRALDLVRRALLGVE